MTDEAKALVERLRWKCIDVMCVERDAHCAEAADLIETQAREIERLREALGELSAAEKNYRKCHDLLGSSDRKTGRAWDLMRRAGDTARAALAGDSHDQ